MDPILRSCTALLLTFVLTLMSLTTGCKSSQKARSPIQNQATQMQVTVLSLSDLVAPIALYPDQLLAQVLTASMNPQEVLDGGNWIIQNQNLKGDALTSAAKTAGFGPSMQYLMNFPQVVDNMCQEIDWTTQLGQAFQSDQQGVMEEVQRKRSQAQQAGNLSSSPQMTVANKSENGQQYVEIQPTDPKVVYVPQYNPVTIYNTQPPAPAATASTTSTNASSGVSTGTAVGIGLLSFGVGMAIGAAINDNHYYPYPAWGYHGVYYGGRRYYPPPYRPTYPGYRPAYGYHPPPNYHWNQYNKNININNNYYTKFNNQNRPNTLPVNTGPIGNTGVKVVNNDRFGQGNRTYQGARPAAPNQKPGASMANVVPRNQQFAAGKNQPSNMTRRSATNVANAQPRINSAGSMNRGGDRGYASPSRASSAMANTSAARPYPSRQMQSRSVGDVGAFGGGSAQADRAASNRGRSSMGATAGRARAGGGRRGR